MMKTKLLLLFVGIFSLMTLTSCSGDDEVEEDDKNVIQPIDVTNTPVAAFFNSEWPEIHHSSGGVGGFTTFFYDPVSHGGIHIYEDTICVINSRQELADIYQGKMELPEIDFDRYTLILGQHVMPYLGFYVSKKELVSGEDGSLILNLYARHDARNDENLATALQILSFWGLYPKQTQELITVNVIKEFPNRE